MPARTSGQRLVVTIELSGPKSAIQYGKFAKDLRGLKVIEKLGATVSHTRRHGRRATKSTIVNK